MYFRYRLPQNLLVHHVRSIHHPFRMENPKLNPRNLHLELDFPMIFRCFVGNVQLPSFLRYEVQDLGAQAHTCPLRYLLPLGLKIGGVKAGL